MSGHGQRSELSAGSKVVAHQHRVAASLKLGKAVALAADEARVGWLIAGCVST